MRRKLMWLDRRIGVYDDADEARLVACIEAAKKLPDLREASIFAFSKETGEPSYAICGLAIRYVREQREYHPSYLKGRVFPDMCGELVPLRIHY